MSDKMLVENIILAYVKDRKYVDERKLLLHTERSFQDVFCKRSDMEAAEVLDDLVEKEAVCYIRYFLPEGGRSKLYFIGGTEFILQEYC